MALTHHPHPHKHAQVRLLLSLKCPIVAFVDAPKIDLLRDAMHDKARVIPFGLEVPVCERKRFVCDSVYVCVFVCVRVRACVCVVCRWLCLLCSCVCVCVRGVSVSVSVCMSV